MTFLYTGAYTHGGHGRSEGIGVWRWDHQSGAVEHLQTLGGIVNPSFLAVGPGGRSLYSVAESPEAGSVVAYGRDTETGLLTELNRQPSGGIGPCHVAVDASGRFVLVANYGSGSIAAYPIADDGSLGEMSGQVQHEGSSVNPNRQEGPHAHMIGSSPDGRFVYVPDLGADRVFAYTLSENGELAQVPDGGATATPGAGPRHFAFSPDGGTVFVINELGGTLTRYAYDPETGRLDRQEEVPTVPAGFEEASCAHVVVSPDGRFVYGSNRTHHSIATWSVGEDGGLTHVDWIPAGGETPRNFALDPTGEWLLVANMGTDNVTVRRRDPQTGLTTGETIDHAIPSCCCLVFA